MSKNAVVYWSGTGNTETMAQTIAEAAGCTAITCDSFTGADVEKYDTIAFGCPAMGAEELEDSTFLPMFESIKAQLSGKRIALFGSYGWGDGEWMRTWEEDCKAAGAILITEPVICCEAPDDDALAACKKLGSEM